jgi:uncharacterized protein
LPQRNPLSRRQFLAGATATALAGAATTALAGTAQPHIKFSATPSAALEEFPYGAVELTGGPLKAQYDHVHASYLALDNNRLLKVYRERAGLPAPGNPMGG